MSMGIRGKVGKGPERPEHLGRRPYRRVRLVTDGIFWYLLVSFCPAHGLANLGRPCQPLAFVGMVKIL